MNAPRPNSMSATWCAARRADARAWVERAPQGEARTHVIELLNQLDYPPEELPDELPAARPYRGQGNEHPTRHEDPPFYSKD